jgi:hypothetical protein
MPNPNNHPYQLLQEKHLISHRDVCKAGGITEAEQYDLRKRIIYSQPITREHAEKVIAGIQKLTGITYSLEEIGFTVLPEGETYKYYNVAKYWAKMSNRGGGTGEGWK